MTTLRVLQHVLLKFLILNVLVNRVKLEVSQSALSQHMQRLWNLDINRFRIGQEIQLNLQSKTSLFSNVDRASGRLFTTVPNLEKKSTYKKFIDLLDNYNPLTHKTDISSLTEREEQKTFINSILGTPVWQETKKILINNGAVSSSMGLTNELHRIWFTEYSRAAGVTGSSGFEHVFVGEIDDKKKQISGLHNWITVFQLENARKINYQGYIKTDTRNSIYEIKLRQQDNTKSGNSMFIGTSPEYEMALYTVCFLLRTDKPCSFTMNGSPITIQVYTSYNKALSTAYPRI